jgi:hypothetical protein
VKVFSWLKESHLWNTFEIEQKLSLLSVGLALAVNLIVWYSTKELDHLYLSLVLTSAGALAADRLARFHSENKTVAELSKFNEHQIRSPLDLHYIGDSVTGVKW